MKDPEPPPPDPVYSVALPMNHPFTGCYALFQPPGENQFPNFEDHILVRREIGGPFKIAFSVYVPFDEDPLRLRDNPKAPNQLVVYCRFYIAYSVDGGCSFHRLTEAQLDVLGLSEGRWSPTGIYDAYVDGQHLFVETCPLMWDIAGELQALVERYRNKNQRTEGTAWRIPLESGGLPDRVGMVPIERRRAARTSAEASAQDLLRTDGITLFARSTSTETFKPVPLMELLQNLPDQTRIDFFGGSGARSFL